MVPLPTHMALTLLRVRRPAVVAGRPVGAMPSLEPTTP